MDRFDDDEHVPHDEDAIAIEMPALDTVLVILEHDLDEGPVVRVHDSRRVLQRRVGVSLVQRRCRPVGGRRERVGDAVHPKDAADVKVDLNVLPLQV